MKRRQALAAMTTLPALPTLGALTTEAATPASPGETVAWPDVVLLDGTPWNAARVQGKAAVVVFWSTSCAFCQRHLAHLAKLQQTSAGLPLEILTVVRERDPAAVRRHLAAQGHHFAVTLDNTAMAAALSQRRMVPLTVTVDRRGRLRQVIPGEMFEDDVLQLARLAT